MSVVSNECMQSLQSSSLLQTFHRELLNSIYLCHMETHERYLGEFKLFIQSTSTPSRFTLNVPLVFLARDVIYTSRTYAMMLVSVCLSVCLSVTFVHCGHRLQWIPDIFACLDRLMSLVYTYWQRLTRIVGWDDAIWWNRQGYGKMGNCSDITYFTYWESGPATCDSFVIVYIIVRVEQFSLVISVENALYLKNGLCYSFPHLALC